MVYVVHEYESDFEQQDDRIWILPMLDDMVRRIGDISITARMGAPDFLFAAKWHGHEHQDEPVFWARIDCWDKRSGVMRVQWTPAEGAFTYVSPPSLAMCWHEVNCTATEIPAVLMTIFVELGRRRVTMISIDTWMKLNRSEVRSSVKFTAPPVGDDVKPDKVPFARHRIVWTQRARDDQARACATNL